MSYHTYLDAATAALALDHAYIAAILRDEHPTYYTADGQESGLDLLRDMLDTLDWRATPSGSVDRAEDWLLDEGRVEGPGCALLLRPLTPSVVAPLLRAQYPPVAGVVGGTLFDRWRGTMTLQGATGNFLHCDALYLDLAAGCTAGFAGGTYKKAYRLAGGRLMAGGPYADAVWGE